MKPCIFCQIVSGEAPAYKVWEDSDFLAILDIFPKIPGQVILILKKHEDSYLFHMKGDSYKAFFDAAKKVGVLMDITLGTSRTAMAMEGLDVNHAHLKLYPVYSPKKYSESMLIKPNRMSDGELQLIADKFRKEG
jgi:histidine triad (HIT) family protein